MRAADQEARFDIFQLSPLANSKNLSVTKIISNR